MSVTVRGSAFLGRDLLHWRAMTMCAEPAWTSGTTARHTAKSRILLVTAGIAQIVERNTCAPDSRATALCSG